MKNSTATKFSALSIGLHWLMLLLLAAVYATMELRGIFPKGSAPRDAMKMWHYMLGLTVFGLVWVRLIARLIYATPPIQPTPPKWQTYLASMTHAALYALMIAMPLLGWTILSAEGKPIPFFGLQLPALVAESKVLAEQIMEIHETIGTVGYFLIGLHAAAALFHHYVARDNTLQRMSPFSR
ncbi:MAG TPA: cytochrome b [Spongiibacteraceae bacterium]|nr:cytochrome b [Spongiibacteraceae bacterium]